MDLSLQLNCQNINQISKILQTCFKNDKFLQYPTVSDCMGCSHPTTKVIYNLSILCKLGILCMFFSVPHLLSELYFDIIKC